MVPPIRYTQPKVERFVIIYFVAIGVILFFIYLVVAFGDDSEDPVGQCLAGNQRICDKLDIEKLMAQLDERAKQWNGDSKMCFATPELMAKFLEQNPDGRFNITVPCPPMKIPHQEDESGK